MAVEISSGEPYIEYRLNNGDRLRVFKEEVPEEYLVWHRDKEDRDIYIEDNQGWKLQMDNDIPKHLEKDKNYFIPKDVYHRIVKGYGRLIIRIKKL